MRAEYAAIYEQNNDVVRIVYEQTKLFDPTRPCIDTSGNYHVETDIFDVHDYEQNPEIFKEHYDKLMTENISEWTVFVLSCSQRKPLVFTQEV